MSDTLTTGAIKSSYTASSRMIDESFAVPVKVASGVNKRRFRRLQCLSRGIREASGITGATVTAVGGVEAGHRHPAEGLAVAARLDCDRALVIDGEITNVRVAAEYLDRRFLKLGLHANGIPDDFESTDPVVDVDWVVASENEHVDGLICI